jgi:alginate O-acetyltransferase complex protein AlgI
MLFTSPVFLSFFFPALVGLYFLLPCRSLVLLLASLLFYAWGEPVMVTLLVGVILGNYLMGLGIEAAPDEASRRIRTSFGVAANVLVLIVFKYAGFLVANLNELLALVRVAPLPVPNITLPLGVSFFTFQAISYLVDIFRRDVRAERNLIRMGVFKALFPQLIAGPIVRYKEIAGGLRNRAVSAESLAAGAERFVFGLGKKVLIADPLSIPVDYIFGTPTADLSSPLAWVGVASFALQIYFDFSAYSDMAIGLAMMFGFRFPENFNMPYVATSVQDFWRRWHMTLSRWFRDYLYIPLGGNRRGPRRTIVNLWIVFAVTGIWHGASWTFLIWGLWHGALLTLERSRFGDFLERWPVVWRRLYVLVAVMLGWVWFRATGFDHALGYFEAMFFGGLKDAPADILRLYNPFLATVLLAGAALALGGQELAKPLIGWRSTTGERRDVLTANIVQRLSRNIFILALAGAALFAAAASTLQAFLYFRF